MASVDLWNDVRTTLKKNFGLNDAHVMWLGDIRDELKELASPGIATAPDFTLHNQTHSDDIVLLLGRLAELCPLGLSEYETRILMAAAYLHDIGMFMGAGRFRESVLPNIQESLRFCEKDLCDGGVHYLEALAGQPVSSQIRIVHHLLSARMILEDGDRAYRLQPRDKPHVIAICRGHRKADLCDQQCGCYKSQPVQFGVVRRDLLAGLLRLADALDFYPQRAPDGAFRTRAPDFLGDPIALKHWLNHYFATSVYVTTPDRTGDRILDCRILYRVPSDRTLNGQPYKAFFTPLFQGFLEEARATDFDMQQYPPVFLQILNIKNISIEIDVRAEPGGPQLPDRIVAEIERSGCQDIIEFLSYLERKRVQEVETPEAATEEPPVIDRRPEMSAFECMLDGDDPQHRLMLLVGDHGQGKTWLIGNFERKAAKRHVPCLKLDLGEGVEANQLLDAIWRHLGPHRFPSYSALRQRAELTEQQTPEERQVELTKCLFTEWLAMEDPPPLVILLDTYERAGPALRQWIEDVFLEQAKLIESIIIVIGGRRRPLLSADYLLEHAHYFRLKGVQVRDYKRYAEQQKVPMSEAELVELHRVTNGLPKLFAEHVEARRMVVHGR